MRGVDFQEELPSEEAKILRDAVEVAIERGYQTSLSVKRLRLSAWEGMIRNNIYMDVIFSHDFAKPFFGEELMFQIDSTPGWAHDAGDIEKQWVNEKELEEQGYDMWEDEMRAFEYHLREMVIQEKPLMYLKQFLGKEVQN